MSNAEPENSKTECFTSSHADLIVPEPAEILVRPEKHASWCPDCGADDAFTLSVQKITTKDSTGWMLNGTGAVLCTCPACGAMFNAVRYRIPIECGSFDCPTCHRYENLQYRVTQIDAAGRDFTFEADIVCRSCSTQRTIFHALKNILTIKKLEVKVDGISVER
jgi:hypothetical protein